MPQSLARSTMKALENLAREKTTPRITTPVKKGERIARKSRIFLGGSFNGAPASAPFSTPKMIIRMQRMPGMSAIQKISLRSASAKKRRRLAIAGPTKAPAASSDCLSP